MEHIRIVRWGIFMSIFLLLSVKFVAGQSLESPLASYADKYEWFLFKDKSQIEVEGVNDVLMIQTRSLESLDFQIFNRWGRIVHKFSKSGYIPADSELAAWDGKVNGKLATPGVYFYVVDAKGRDGERRRKKGFVQMIW